MGSPLVRLETAQFSPHPLPVMPAQPGFLPLPGDLKPILEHLGPHLNIIGIVSLLGLKSPSTD